MNDTTKPKATIYDISDDMAALESLLWESGGDISTPEAAAAVAAWEAELEANLHWKLDAYGPRDSSSRSASRRLPRSTRPRPTTCANGFASCSSSAA